MTSPRQLMVPVVNAACSQAHRRKVLYAIICALMLFICGPQSSLAKDVFKMGIGDPIDSGAGSMGKSSRELLKKELMAT